MMSQWPGRRYNQIELCLFCGGHGEGTGAGAAQHRHSAVTAQSQHARVILLRGSLIPMRCAGVALAAGTVAFLERA